MKKCFQFFLGFLLILSEVNSEEIIYSNSSFVYQRRNVSHDTPQSRVKRDKGDNLCGISDPLTYAMNFFLPNPSDPREDAKVDLQLFVRSEEKTMKTQITEKGRIMKLQESKFSPEKKTVVIVHGFQGNGEAGWIDPMVQAYLKYADVNVIVVDWGTLASTLNYRQASWNTVVVGKQVKDLLLDIMTTLENDKKPIHWGPMHLIGFSMGAHAVGIIAHQLKKNESSWLVERITGLDPAHPCFTGTENSLDKGDAPFVDVIHTSGNKAFGLTLGMLQDIGHVDFYMNGGQLQPACKWNGWISFFLELLYRVSYAIDAATCSHLIAPAYFTESLEVAGGSPGRPLTGIKWEEENFLTRVYKAVDFVRSGNCGNECQQMGINANASHPGRYFVPTAMKKPFYDIGTSDQQKIIDELTRNFEW